MKNLYIEPFNVMGITIKTDNTNQKCSKDISELWKKFINDNIIDQISNKIDDSIYCIYTDYEGDYTNQYLVLLGCKVSSSDFIPDGLVVKKIGGGNYNMHIVKGNILQGIVLKQWKSIWNSNISRAYTCDFEVYNKDLNNHENTIVKIFVAIKDHYIKP
ncbi:MAG TPA: GyrI-like domain-containing protein [Burkholderiales bacterium]|nr:GyrI-like domain-containing protein [Burkholderiales bacterium]